MVSGGPAFAGYGQLGKRIELRGQDPSSRLVQQPQWSKMAYALARTCIVLGRRADAAVTQFEDAYPRDWADEIPALRAFRREPEPAFALLDRAYRRRNGALVGVPPVNIDPDVTNLHGDSLWNAFLRKLGLPE